MSTKQPRSRSEFSIDTDVRRPLLHNAPRTFDPHNTRDCPQHFADKWTVAGE